MPHTTKKKQRLKKCDQRHTSFDDVLDVLPNILGFLKPKHIMRARRVCKHWTDAARNTIVPPTDFRVNSTRKYNAMNVMTRALPNLQQIKIGYPERGHKWSDGEYPDEGWAAETADWTSHDIEIISNFSKLRVLEMDNSSLNGRYPFLFNSFPLLQKLSIQFGIHLNFDLEMLAGLPLLKELECLHTQFTAGNINSLRVLKDTLEKVKIYNCPRVEGNFIDLADFPNLKELNLITTAVTGDIRDIGKNDFSSLEKLALPHGVYGKRGCKFQRITEAPDVIRAVYLLKKRRPALKMKDWYGVLSRDSPDWYDSAGEYHVLPPFSIHFVKAGSRIGYRWSTSECRFGYKNDPCEVNWLDPEPDRASSDYAKYIKELQKIERELDLYNGFQQPPTEEEYNRLAAMKYER